LLQPTQQRSPNVAPIAPFHEEHKPLWEGESFPQASWGPGDISHFDRDAILDRTSQHVNRGLARLAKLLQAHVEVASEGARVYDELGQTYLDCGGYAVFIHGHRHPKIVAAVQRQLNAHPLATRVLLNPGLALAAEALARVAPPGLPYVLFTNSGAEAVEAALKLACLNGKTVLVSATNSFHGKTTGALSVTGRPAFRDPFHSLLTDVQFVPFGDAAALESLLAEATGRACVILEPIQAEAGVILPPDGYLRDVRGLCDRYGALFVADEIQTGCGRTGSWWALDRERVIPNILLAGKGLGGGVVPVAALIASADVFEPFNRDPLLHTSTFAGNPLATAAALAAVQVLVEDGLVERARELGAFLLDRLTTILSDHGSPVVRSVRGAGLLIGIEFDSERSAGSFMMELLRRRVVTCHSLNSHRVVRLTPPAILSPDECEWLFEAVREAALAVNVPPRVLGTPADSPPSRKA
jgi:putrescine aminotransferase